MLPAKLKNLFSLATTVASEAVEAIQILSADDELLGQIAAYLQQKPQTWLLVTPSSEWYGDILADISDVYPALKPNPIIVISATHRWTLIGTHDHILPLIFMNKGGSTRLFRMVVGPQAHWVPTLTELVMDMLRGRVTSEPQPSDLAVSSLPARDPKWDIGAGGVGWL